MVPAIASPVIYRIHNFVRKNYNSVKKVLLGHSLTAAIVLIGALIASTYLYCQRVYTRADFFRLQSLRWHEARELADEIGREIDRNGGPSLLSLHRPAKRFTVRFPEADIYLLDEEGVILRNLSTGAALGSPSVDMRPIRQLLSMNTPLEGLVTGEDPNDSGREKPFLAAPLKLGTSQCFVYIILHNRVRRLLEIPVLEKGHWAGYAAFTFCLLCVTALIVVSLRALLRQMSSRLAAIVRSLAPDLPDHAPEPGADIVGVERQLTSLVEAIAKDRADLRGRQKQSQRLISQVSHDFRSPLFLIQEYTKRLVSKASDPEPEESKQELASIQRNVQSLIALLSEFSLLNQVKAGQRIVNHEVFNIRELANDIILAFAIEGESRGVNLRIESASDFVPVNADPLLIERVLRNLFENALRHSSRGGIVEIKLVLEPAHVLVVLSDTGAGIPSDELPHIFEPFHQVRKNRTSNGTSGLGLAIVSEVLNAHQSKIEVTSVEGAGTTFQFRLERYPGDNRIDDPVPDAKT